MKIEGNKVIFKSIPEFWEKEFSGKKPYTVRLLDKVDFLLLQDMLDEHSNLLIEIRSTETECSFVREVRDVSLFGEFLGKYLVGIAWQKPKKSEKKSIWERLARW